MKTYLLAGISLVVAGVAFACSSNGGSSGNADGGKIDASLPCDVNDFLVARCGQCHGATPTDGAPMALVSHADLIAPSKSDPTKTNAEASLARMQSASEPMPPAPASPPTQAEIATLQKWIDGKYTHGDCTGDTKAGNPYDGASTCTSNKRWALGDTPSPLMHPGQACIACHSTQPRAPVFDIAGTVYPSAHEPTDCNGVNGTSTSAKVVITDAKGKTFTLTVNAAGSFYDDGSNGTIVTPFHAKVVVNGKERVMLAAQTNGDCNACHTEVGDKDAPGRIVAP